MSDQKQIAREQARQQSVDRVMDGSSWNEFCDALKSAGNKVILSNTAPTDPIGRAEGWRYMARLTRAALESFLEAADTQAPEFSRAVHETIKMGMDNPDNIYLAAPVNGSYTYKITGNRGSVHYLGFGAQAGGYGKTNSLDTTGYLEAKDLILDASGNFEIVVSCTQPESTQNWLKMSPDTKLIQVRQTRLDHKKEIPAIVKIVRTDGPNQPRHLSAERVDKALQGVAFFVAGTSQLFAQWTEDFRKHPNTLPRFDPAKATQAGGDPNIAYYHGYFKIADDEALQIEFTPPECDFWNFQLANYWLESLDYRYFPVHLNKHMAAYNDDGSVRIIVSKTRPSSKVANWLDTCDHNEGTMCVRWIRSKSFPEPQTRVVKLNSL